MSGRRLGSVTADYSSRVSALAVTRRGSGPPCGAGARQRDRRRADLAGPAPLAERYTLLVVDRPGFGDAPPPDGRVDWETDAALVAEALPDGRAPRRALLRRGHRAARGGRRPDALASLTVVEPPAFAVARGDPDGRALRGRGGGPLAGRAGRPRGVPAPVPRARLADVRRRCSRRSAGPLAGRRAPAAPRAAAVRGRASRWRPCRPRRSRRSRSRAAITRPSRWSATCWPASCRRGAGGGARRRSRRAAGRGRRSTSCWSGSCRRR